MAMLLPEMLGEVAARLERPCDRAAWWDVFAKRAYRLRPADAAPVDHNARTTAVQRSRSYSVARHGSAAQWDDWRAKVFACLTPDERRADVRLGHRLITGAAQGTHTDRLLYALAEYPGRYERTIVEFAPPPMCFHPVAHAEGARCQPGCHVRSLPRSMAPDDFFWMAVDQCLRLYLRNTRNETPAEAPAHMLAAMFAALQPTADPGAFATRCRSTSATPFALPLASRRLLAETLAIHCVSVDSPMALAGLLSCHRLLAHELPPLIWHCNAHGSLAMVRLLATVSGSYYRRFAAQHPVPRTFAEARREVGGTVMADGVIAWFAERGVETYTAGDAVGKTADEVAAMEAALARHLRYVPPGGDAHV